MNNLEVETVYIYVVYIHCYYLMRFCDIHVSYKHHNVWASV